MISEDKIHKIKQIKEPSKSLEGMSKRRNKKSGAMSLAGVRLKILV